MQLPLSILDEFDMSKARTPEEFQAWVIQKCEELAQSPETKAFSHSGALLAKKFHDEIFPLSRFVAHEYQMRSDILVQPNLSNDNFDAKIITNDGARSLVEYVEITCAKDGYDESLRMEVLLREGHVSITGPITVSGRRGSSQRSVTVATEAAFHTETLEKYLCVVEAAIEGKVSVQYGLRHTLLVAVDDYYALIQDSDWPLVEARVKAKLGRLQLDFGRVVLSGLAGRLFLSFDRPFKPSNDAH